MELENIKGSNQIHEHQDLKHNNIFINDGEERNLHEIDINSKGLKTINASYKIQASFNITTKINNFVLKFGEDHLSFWHVESNTKILTIIFNDIIGATRSETTSIPKLEQANLSAKAISLNYCPKLANKREICCGSQITSSDGKIRFIKRIFILIESELEHELLNVLNNIALCNNFSKIEPSKKKYLVFVNPVSGKGKSLKKWAEAKEVFDLSHIDIELIRTTHCRHAYEFVLSMETKKYDGVICISGDGIVHEVMNALMHRNDSLKDEIIVGTIPAGTGNGLSKTIAEEHGENYDIISFAYMLCKGHSIKMDLYEIELLSQDKLIYAFHSLSSGLVADVGIDSEKLRCIGDLRFKLYSLWRLITLNSKHFYASMYYPEKEELDQRSIDEFPALRKELPEQMTNLKDEIRFMYVMNLRWTTEEINAPEQTKLDDGLMDIVLMRGNRSQLLRVFKEFKFENLLKDKKENPEAGLSYRRTNFLRYIPLHNLNDNEDINTKNDVPSYLNIDGERYRLDPFQMKVKQRCINVFSFKQKI